jgi:hypothetical protein
VKRGESMQKTVRFEYLRLTIIHSKTEKSISFKDLITILEAKPLDISKNFSKTSTHLSFKQSFLRPLGLSFILNEKVSKMT